MSLKKLTGGVACVLPSPTRGHHSRIRLDNALAGTATLPCTIIPFAVTESMLVSPRCYRSVILHLEFFYPINIDRRVLSGYECRTLSLLFLSLPSCRFPPSLAHIGSVDSCVCTYFTDRLQAGDIWRIVVGFYRSRFMGPLHSFTTANCGLLYSLLFPCFRLIFGFLGQRNGNRCVHVEHRLRWSVVSPSFSPYLTRIVLL